MIPRSLQARLTLLQQGLALLVVAAFAFSALWITRATLYREETQALQAEANRVAVSLDLELAEEHDMGRAIASVLQEEAPAGMRVTIEDSLGHALANSPEQRSPRTQKNPTGGNRARTRSKSGAWIEVATSDRLREASVAALARALFMSAVPLLLIAFFLSRWTVQRALRPLEAMARRAGAIALDADAHSLGETGGLEELERMRIAFDRLLDRLNEQLRAERQFASDASHELRTPLTLLAGEIELAQASPANSPETREGLARAADQARAMRDLVEALMLLRRASEGSRLVRQAFEPVDLSDVVEAARRENEARHHDRRADLNVDAALDVVVSGHPILLVAGVRNLLDNALKFTPAGTRVQVSVSQDAAWARIRVEDAGPGIPETDRERVFDPFFRGAEARAGSSGFGLGLPILRRVARVHGGDVSVTQSSLGGACLTLTLPCWRPFPAGLDPVQA